MNYSNHYKIDGQDCWTTWGVIFEKGTYAELLKPAKRKEGTSHSWPEEDGTDRYIPDTPLKESRELELPVAFIASGEADFLTKFNGFVSYLQGAGYFTFQSVDLNKSFTLLYDEATDTNIITEVATDGEVIAKMKLKLIDDL